jgi:hypothetical protein
MYPCCLKKFVLQSVTGGFKRVILQSVTGGFKRVILQSADTLKICLPLPSVYVLLVLIKYSLFFLK